MIQQNPRVLFILNGVNPFEGFDHASAGSCCSWFVSYVLVFDGYSWTWVEREGRLLLMRIRVSFNFNFLVIRVPKPLLLLIHLIGVAACVLLYL